MSGVADPRLGRLVAPAEEPAALAAALRGRLAREYPATRLVAQLSGEEPAVPGWPVLAELGWLDELGGVAERAVLAEECGYACVPLPWLSRTELPSDVGAQVGHRRAALVDTAETRVGGIAAPGVGADAPRGRVTAEVGSVLEAADAEVLVVLTGARTLLVDAGSAGVDVAPGPVEDCGDRVRRLARVSLTAAAGDVLGVPAGVVRAGARRRGTVLRAAEAVGVGRRALEIAAAHARTRVQFGRPVGSFQGIAFGIADALVGLETAAQLVADAAGVLDASDAAGGPDTTSGPDATDGPDASGAYPDAADPDGADVAAARALLAARRAGVRACEQAVQTLGGTGMTWEHPVHWWYRRVLWTAMSPPASSTLRERVAAAALGSWADGG